MLFDDSTGEKICSKCGYVVEQSVLVPHNGTDSTPKASSAMSDSGSSTIIDPQNKDALGRAIPPSMKGTIKRLKKLDSRTKTQSPVEKNLKQAEIEIGKLKDKLILSDPVIEKTKNIYKNIVERKLTRGYTIKGMIGACLYASCKDMGIPRTMDEISNIIDIKKNNISICYKLIVREFDLQIPVIDPIKHVSRIASILGLSEKTKRKAISIRDEAPKAGINVGQEPIGIIAGALYLAGIRIGELKSQKEIADASGVTEVTIRKRCKEIIKIIDW